MHSLKSIKMLCAELLIILVWSQSFSCIPLNLQQNIYDSLTGRIQWDANNSAVQCAFTGNDLTNALSKPEDCHGLCASTPECTHYTWTDFNSGTCWMKANAVSRSQAITKLEQNAICGIVQMISPGATHTAQKISASTIDLEASAFHRFDRFSQWENDRAINSTRTGGYSDGGRSTRYWDCCKV